MELIAGSSAGGEGAYWGYEDLPVIDWSAPALLLLALVLSGGTPAPQPDEYAQLTVRERIIVRIPDRARAVAAAPQLQWKESKGPKCVPARFIAGAALAGRDRVDLVLRDRRRVRAELDDDCPALDYYYGFYITPNRDGQVCADRDIIRSRTGGQCGIERFRALAPVAGGRRSP